MHSEIYKPNNIYCAPQRKYKWNSSKIFWSYLILAKHLKIAVWGWERAVRRGQWLSNNWRSQQMQHLQKKKVHFKAHETAFCGMLSKSIPTPSHLSLRHQHSVIWGKQENVGFGIFSVSLSPCLPGLFTSPSSIPCSLPFPCSLSEFENSASI